MNTQQHFFFHNYVQLFWLYVLNYKYRFYLPWPLAIKLTKELKQMKSNSDLQNLSGSNDEELDHNYGSDSNDYLLFSSSLQSNNSDYSDRVKYNWEMALHNKECILWQHIRISVRRCWLFMIRYSDTSEQSLSGLLVTCSVPIRFEVTKINNISNKLSNIYYIPYTWQLCHKIPYKRYQYTKQYILVYTTVWLVPAVLLQTEVFCK